MKMIILYIICLSMFLAGCVSPWRYLPDAGTLSTTPEDLIRKEMKEPVFIAVNRIISRNRDLREHRLGRLFSDKLTRALIDDSNFRVVSRSLMEQILEEQEFGMSGLVDSELAAKMGRIAGAKAIIIGSLSLSQHREKGYPLKFVKVDVELQFIDTETAELIALISSAGFDEYDYLMDDDDIDSAVDRTVRAVYADIHNYMMKRYCNSNQ